MQDLQNQVESTKDLSSIARAMKALAAVRIRQSREAVTSLAAYARTVDLGFRVLLTHQSLPLSSLPSGGRTLALVMGSDLGMVGGFNRRMADFVADHLPERGQGEEGPGPTVLVTVGERVAGELGGARGPIMARFPMPDTVDAMADRVQDLLVTVERIQEETEPERVLAFHHAYRSGADYEPRMIQLLPLDPAWMARLSEEPWPSRVIPSFRTPSDVLLSSLVREHLFVSLFRAMAESHASENAGRLAAMEAAERRIDEQLEELTGRLKQQRKQQMTEELLDIMAGVAALDEEEGEMG